MQTTAKYLIVMALMLVLFEPTKIFAGQNIPLRSAAGQAAIGSSGLDRLTLSLVDRLPTDSEREFVRAHGSRGPFELANQLVGGREFFDRISLYWQSQLNQTPAWLWENKSGGQALFVSALQNLHTNNKIVWYVRPTGYPSQHSCTGLWTLLDENQAPRTCSCEELVDALPAWDTSSSMRVCPIVKNEEYCGSSLQNCVPADARINPKNPFLAVDSHSAGGRAITRLLSDISLSQGRSLAAAVVARRKWSELTVADAQGVQSRSSIELLRKWSELTASETLRGIHIALNLSQQSRPLKDIINQTPTANGRRYNRPMGESPAEELLLTSGVHPRTNFRPLRATALNERVWQWNTQLLLNCQIPHLAPQQFSLPLPHPNLAKEGSYFCSSCHLSLDKALQGNSQNQRRELTAAAVQLSADSQTTRMCAIDHALQFLLGYRPTGASAAVFRRVGTNSYQLNAESLAAVIRDLSLELARREPE
ncbi:MAG: hypothetical protein RI932_497 [Pseudomonadota bacterium]